jgi:O-acetyl-ADP-ribose deacetylase (regulator of RNase III)
MKTTLLIADITQASTDVIVNSAHKSLFRGSGVCGAIHKAAGPELEKECLEKRGTKFLGVGEVLVTNAYNLPAKHVIHTVGPRQGVDNISLLKNCYINSIKKADELKAESISFPAIATNIYGVPIEFSAKVVKGVLDELEEPKFLKEIKFIFMKQSDIDVYKSVLIVD